jgi:hypothetical protein
MNIGGVPYAKVLHAMRLCAEGVLPTPHEGSGP